MVIQLSTLFLLLVGFCFEAHAESKRSYSPSTQQPDQISYIVGRVKKLADSGQTVSQILETLEDELAQNPEQLQPLIRCAHALFAQEYGKKEVLKEIQEIIKHSDNLKESKNLNARLSFLSGFLSIVVVGLILYIWFRPPPALVAVAVAQPPADNYGHVPAVAYA